MNATPYHPMDFGDGDDGDSPVVGFPDQTGDLVIAPNNVGATTTQPAVETGNLVSDEPLTVGHATTSHIVITAVYDSSVTSLATSNPTLYANYTAAVQTAIQYYESVITTPITVTINFGWGEVGGSAIDPGANGESSAFVYSTTYAKLYAAVVKTETTSAVQLAAVAALPTTDPTGGATFSIATAEAKALGFTLNGYTIGGYVGLDSSSNTTWSWSQSNVAANTADAVGTLEHEISEVLGRADNGGQGSYTLLDMFRYTASNGGKNDAPGTAVGARDEPFVSGYSANAYSYFSYNGQTITLPYETPADVSGGADIADWSPAVSNDSFADGGYDGADPVSATDLQEMNVLGYDLACFAAGTRILTTRGLVAVEALGVGDRAMTHDGTAADIIWVGHRRVACARHPAPHAVWPVRVMEGAFGPGIPARDVLFSPDHAIYTGGVLIPVRYLVNGASIRREPRDRITYYHVELDRHAVLLAEGLPAESYLDTGNRGAFAGGGDSPVPLHPDFSFRIWATKSCAPLALSGAPVLATRRLLRDRAASLGFSHASDPMLRLAAAGLSLRGEERQGWYRFAVPEGIRVARLLSRHAVPAEIAIDSGDHRRLGVAVRRIAVGGAELPLDDPRLGAGWHEVEPGWRWTDGAAEIFVAGGGALEIDVAIAGPYWLPPSQACRSAAA